MLRAGKRANERGIPIVLDPVGAGATGLRTQTSLQLLNELHISVVRGNAAEVAALVGVTGETRGVESISVAEDRGTVARRAANEFGCIVAITGAQDLISNGNSMAKVDNGHPLLASITGSGCMATSLVGAFLAIEPDPFYATTTALMVMGLAGEFAAPKSGGPGTFRSQLLDAVAAMNEEAIVQGQKVSFA